MATVTISTTNGTKGTLPYDKVTGRRSAQEMADAQAQPPTDED